MPFRYTVDGGAPFAFAGLWDEGRVGGERLASVTILTTSANARLRAGARPHAVRARRRRRPRRPGSRPTSTPTAALELLGVLAAARTAAAPANPAVNKAGVEGAELLVAPAPRSRSQLELG